MAGGIAGAGKQLGDGHFPLGESVQSAANRDRVCAGANRKAPGHYRGATRSALRLDVEVPGCRCQEIILVTTLLDAQRFGAARLAEFYFRRWEVELHFRQIKIMLGMDVLRCMSSAIVRKEILMHLVAYNPHPCTDAAHLLDLSHPAWAALFQGSAR